MCYADRTLESVMELLRSQSAQQQQNDIHTTQNAVKSKNGCMEFLGRLGLSQAQKVPQAQCCVSKK